MRDSNAERVVYFVIGLSIRLFALATNSRRRFEAVAFMSIFAWFSQEMFDRIEFELSHK